MLPVNALTIDRLIRENAWNHGAELGVRRGDFTAGLCSVNLNLKMIAVDLWADAPFMNDVYDHAANYAIALERFQPYSSRITIIRESFENAACHVPEGSLDFIYLDGTHTYIEVLKDISLWSPKVHCRGVIAGHDYHPAFDSGGVIRAIEGAFSRVTVDEHTTWYAWKVDMHASRSNLK